jgi:hypothetical protein
LAEPPGVVGVLVPPGWLVPPGGSCTRQALIVQSEPMPAEYSVHLSGLGCAARAGLRDAMGWGAQG